MIIKHIIKRTFGDKNEWGIPVGPALVYFYRRFGFTEHGSDSDKQVCRYVLPTAVNSLCVSFWFGGTRCYIHPSMAEELLMEYEREERRPFTEWWKRCAEWAGTQGTPLLVDAWDDVELYISQAEAWLETQGVTEEITEAEFIEKWSSKYVDHKMVHNKSIGDAYEKIDPRPVYTEAAQSEVGKACEAAVGNVLRDLLRPVSVRDVFINVLGAVELGDETESYARMGDYDESRDMWENEAERSFMAGNGVVTEVYRDFDLYLSFLDVVREQGGGDLLAGMRMICEKRPFSPSSPQATGQGERVLKIGTFRY